jgi:hypothetical protein
MKSKNRIVLIVLFLSILIILISCEKQKAEWKGTTDEVDGVTVVKNPKEPIYGEDVFSLEEELSIKEVEGREEYIFSLIRSIAVDNRERIFVLDIKEANMKVFDRDGNYIRTIGTKGQGPGEMIRPLFLFISSQNEIIIHDQAQRRMIYYSSDGNQIKSVSSSKVFIRSISLDSEGNFIADIFIRKPKERLLALCKFDSDFNNLRSYVSYPDPWSGQTANNLFVPYLCWAVDKNDNIIYGYTDKYEFNVLNPEGNLIRKIIRKYTPLKISRDEKKMLIEQHKNIPFKLDIPKYYPPHDGLMLDDEGRIFVQTYKQPEDGRGFYYDVFDPEGRYIANIFLKSYPRAWKKDKLYTIERDEEGYHLVKRYKVTWKY